jgi:hypothetical protein
VKLRRLLDTDIGSIGALQSINEVDIASVQQILGLVEREIASPPDDGENAALFRRWRSEMTRYQEEVDEAAADEIIEQSAALFRAICDQPARGVAGFAIKAFLAAHSHFPSSNSADEPSLGAPDGDQIWVVS